MDAMEISDLDRFTKAQDPVFGRVVTELSNGRKASHWMWFIFPQLAGLGRSPTAVRFAIRDLAEARRYLAHPVLGERLRKCCSLMLEHAEKSAYEILGTPDDLKFRSCLTLFLHAAEDQTDRELFDRCLGKFYDGTADARTTALLEAGSPPRTA